MFDNSGLVKLRRMGVVMYCWIKNATRRKKEPCPKCQKRKVQKMLLQQSAMDRLNHEISFQRDRYVRLQSVQNDMALDLPHSIPLPDGEEIPYGSSTRLQIRDPEQESEIYQKCIRPPPNRTISGGDTSPEYLHLIAATLERQSKKSSGDFFGRTARCLGFKKNEFTLPPTPPPPCVHVPIHPGNRSRQIAAFAERGSRDIASVPTVSCAVPAQNLPVNRPLQGIPEARSEEKIRSHPAGVTAGAITAGAAAKSGEHYKDTKGPAGATASAIAAARAATSGEHYMDTKGPETRAERALSAYYAMDYYDTKGPERKNEKGSATAAAGAAASAASAATASTSSAGSSTSVAEKKPEKGSV